MVPTQNAASTRERFTFQTTTHGAGGFAKVLKGRDNELERDVAIKILDPLRTEFSVEQQERFRREARTLAKLCHPNIPAIYDVDFSEGRFHIIFQFIEGRTLGDLIQSQGRCALKDAIRWVCQVASALAHAHSLQVVHRDVKPSNIIITADGETAYLVDFGIAVSHKEAKSLTKSGFVIGTRGYMSPEQQAGEDLDARADVFSLAVTLYEALAGSKMTAGDYKDLSDADEAIPPEIDQLIRDSLAPRESRIESARIFSDRLLSALRATPRPLSLVLKGGSLREIASAIEPFSAQEFVTLPAGQKTLILIKLSDIIHSEDPKLHFASARFLELLLMRGLLLPKEEYKEIVNPAMEWGYFRTFGSQLGETTIRDAIIKAVTDSRADSYVVLCDQAIAFLQKVDLSTCENWYLHPPNQEPPQCPPCQPGMLSASAADRHNVKKGKRDSEVT